MRFGYQSEKFSAARSALMLPHPNGQAASIASAFYVCSRGLRDLKLEDTADNVSAWVHKLQEFMNTDGLTDDRGVGLWHIKAESLSTEQLFELSHIVDELASWFDRECWSQ